jgi:hypothetical protein
MIIWILKVLVIYAIMGYVSYKLTYMTTLAILRYFRPFNR